MKGKLVWKGGAGSGHHGHQGRPGKRGGSSPGSGSGSSGGSGDWPLKVNYKVAIDAVDALRRSPANKDEQLFKRILDVIGVEHTERNMRLTQDFMRHKKAESFLRSLVYGEND